MLSEVDDPSRRASSEIETDFVHPCSLTLLVTTRGIEFQNEGKAGDVGV